MTITADELKHVYPNCPDPDTWAAAISKAWAKFGFNSRNARAGFLGIVGNETGGLTAVKRELMTYSPSRARAVFGSTRTAPCAALCPIDDDGHRIRDDKGQAFTSCIYANMLGNGPPATGDGWKYRGAGIIGLTGKLNFKNCGDALGIDLVGNPDLVTEPGTSAMMAAWFMAKLRPQCLKLLEADDEQTYLQGARLVGIPPDQNAINNRINFRRRALEVVRPAGTVRQESPVPGNVVIADIKDSSIIKDSNKGLTVATVTAGAGAVAPVATKVLDAKWEVVAIIAVVVILFGGGALYYFTKVKTARIQMHLDGVA